MLSRRQGRFSYVGPDGGGGRRVPMAEVTREEMRVPVAQTKYLPSAAVDRWCDPPGCQGEHPQGEVGVGRASQAQHGATPGRGWGPQGAIPRGGAV